MNKLREALDRSEPTMAVVFTGAESDELIDDVAALGAVAELRVDLLADQTPDNLKAQITRLAKLPVLLTIRIMPEGGQWQGSMNKRLGLFKSLIPYVDGVDVEKLSKIAPLVADEAHSQDKVVIGSRHNFVATPSTPELERLVKIARRIGADYTKIAATANADDDYDVLKNFTSSQDNLIIVAMGDYGPRSRIELPCLGSRLTYASSGQAVVPGQMNYRQTHEQLIDYAKLF